MSCPIDSNFFFICEATKTFLRSRLSWAIFNFPFVENERFLNCLHFQREKKKLNQYLCMESFGHYTWSIFNKQYFSVYIFIKSGITCILIQDHCRIGLRKILRLEQIVKMFPTIHPRMVSLITNLIDSCTFRSWNILLDLLARVNLPYFKLNLPPWLLPLPCKLWKACS